MSRKQKKLEGYGTKLSDHADHLVRLQSEVNRETKWRQDLMKRDFIIGLVVGFSFIAIGTTLDKIAEQTLMFKYNVGFGGFQALLCLIGLSFILFGIWNKR